MKTNVVVFPFDLFGHAGTRSGSELLGDAIREMLTDNRRERTATRSREYTNKVRVEEWPFDRLEDYASWRAEARTAIAQHLDRDDFVFWCAGNHLGVLPLYDAVAKRPRSLIIQFDAHLDIYNLIDCTTELSHGNFIRHIDGQHPLIVNLGHREQVLRDEAIAKYFRRAISAESLRRERAVTLAELHALCDAADQIVIDIDCDVFDAAYFPAVAQPEPFGMSPTEVLDWLAAVWSPKVRALAISEFLPAYDNRDRSLATLLWLAEWIFLRNHERR